MTKQKYLDYKKSILLHPYMMALVSVLVLSLSLMWLFPS